jgi:hypothetical protein
MVRAALINQRLSLQSVLGPSLPTDETLGHESRFGPLSPLRDEHIWDRVL